MQSHKNRAEAQVVLLTAKECAQEKISKKAKHLESQAPWFENKGQEFQNPLVK